MEIIIFTQKQSHTIEHRVHRASTMHDDPQAYGSGTIAILNRLK